MILGMLVLLFFINFYASYTSSSQTIAVVSDYNVKILSKNCLITMRDRAAADSVVVSYEFNKGTPYAGVQDSSSRLAVTSSTSQSIVIQAVSSFHDLKFCTVDILVPSALQIDTLEFDCQGDDSDECVFV